MDPSELLHMWRCLLVVDDRQRLAIAAPVFQEMSRTAIRQRSVGQFRRNPGAGAGEADEQIAKSYELQGAIETWLETQKPPELAIAHEVRDVLERIFGSSPKVGMA
jgi:hypothetical protein